MKVLNFSNYVSNTSTSNVNNNQKKITTSYTNDNRNWKEKISDKLKFCFQKISSFFSRLSSKETIDNNVTIEVRSSEYKYEKKKLTAYKFSLGKNGEFILTPVSLKS